MRIATMACPLASSLSELAQMRLDLYGEEMSDKQRAVVESVVETGEIAAADYESALSDYRRCMLDLGYKEIVFVDVGKGLKVETVHQSGTAEQEMKYGEDRVACSALHSMDVETLYESQVGNVTLIKDQYDAVADCLKRDGLVDGSYTGEAVQGGA